MRSLSAAKLWRGSGDSRAGGVCMAMHGMGVCVLKGVSVKSDGKERRGEV